MENNEDDIKIEDIEENFDEKIINETNKKIEEEEHKQETEVNLKNVKVTDLREAILDHLAKNTITGYSKREIQRMKKANLINLYNELKIKKITQSSQTSSSKYDTAKKEVSKAVFDKKLDFQSKMMTNLILTTHMMMERSEPVFNKNTPMLSGLYENTKNDQDMLNEAFKPFCEEYEEFVSVFATPLMGLAIVEGKIISATIASNLNSSVDETTSDVKKN